MKSVFLCILLNENYCLKARDYQGKRVNPPYRSSKVIPLKLFLDMVPSSSEDATRAMRGQPKRLSRNYLRGNGRNVILYVLTAFHSRDVFCTLMQPSFCSAGLSFVLCSFGCSLFGCLFGLSGSSMIE